MGAGYRGQRHNPSPGPHQKGGLNLDFSTIQTLQTLCLPRLRHQNLAIPGFHPVADVADFNSSHKNIDNFGSANWGWKSRGAIAGTWIRVLSPEEYARLLAHCPANLKPIVKLACRTGMRQGEILSLSWGQVDLREGFIRLRPEDTKTNEGRLAPFNGELREMCKELPRNLPAARVFNRNGKPIASIREVFEAACRRGGN